MIKMIFAMDLVGGIGKNGTLPWHFKEDLEFFKSKTKGKMQLMGKNTWNDPKFPRKIIENDYHVFTRHPYELKDSDKCVVHRVNNYDIVKPTIKLLSTTRDVWVIGGSTLYNEMMGTAQEIWVTVVNDVYECDTFIDGEKLNDLYKITECKNGNTYGLQFLKYELV